MAVRGVVTMLVCSVTVLAGGPAAHADVLPLPDELKSMTDRIPFVGSLLSGSPLKG
ncbi:hypothetical protein EDD29_2528 [Actinocorallia herbida]|uniref:Uncharacterized protein n=1 Tax=Actinocorallia herbida TaxID=58109 RepID=A0A3N1CUU4_9ACTN|nr:hypothetical protein [Actinocorallia herbida]ROO84994.1 hypothetical protein EDD29_2528 [Actinocorallia herbida]